MQPEKKRKKEVRLRNPSASLSPSPISCRQKLLKRVKRAKRKPEMEALLVASPPRSCDVSCPLWGKWTVTVMVRRPSVTETWTRFFRQVLRKAGRGVQTRNCPSRACPPRDVPSALPSDVRTFHSFRVVDEVSE